MSDDWDDDDDDDIPEEWRGDAHALLRAGDEDRVSVVEAERARRLICDSALASAIAAEVPGDAERVALAVGEGLLPPHLIVGRAERLYKATLLGRDMAPRPGTPIVPFDRVRMHIERADLHAERNATARELWRDRPSVRHLLERCDGAGARLSREDFEDLAALAPILEGKYLDKASEAFGKVLRAAPHILRLKRFPSSIEHKLLAFWNRFHAVGNYTLLAAVRGKESFALLDKIHVDPKLKAVGFDPLRHLFFQPLMLGQSYVALRVFAALARAGEAAVPMIKRQMAEAPSMMHWLLGAYALIAVGRRKRSIRAELCKAVGPARLPLAFRDSPTAIDAAKLLQVMMDGSWAEREEDADAAMRNLAECYARDVRDEHAAKVVIGDELSVARLAATPANFRSLQQDVGQLSTMVLICSEVPAEELYFPSSALASATVPAFSPELTQEYAQIVPPPAEPVRAANKPGRNELCACGSGKKYKHCHGAN